MGGQNDGNETFVAFESVPTQKELHWMVNQMIRGLLL